MSFIDNLNSVVSGKQVVNRSQVNGVQEGHVVSVDVASHTVFITLTNSVFGTDRRFGPIRYGRTSNPPQVSDLCLVEFVGQGVDRGWLVSWTPA